MTGVFIDRLYAGQQLYGPDCTICSLFLIPVIWTAESFCVFLPDYICTDLIFTHIWVKSLLSRIIHALSKRRGASTKLREVVHIQ
jgi:hypothetical protein